MAFLDLDGLKIFLGKLDERFAPKSHTHSYAGSASAGGSANSAVKLDTATAGSATQPVYFSGGKPVAIGYTIAKSVPSNALFTDTNTHYESKNVVGATSATANTTTALTNGNVYLNSVENSKVMSSHKISGSGATTVTTDATGNIVVSSTNTTYSSLKNPYAVTIKANGTSLGTYDGSAAKEFNLTASNVGAAAASHNHSAANITSGTLDLDRIPDVSSKVTTVAVSKLDGVIDASHLPSYVDDVLEGYLSSDGKFYKTKASDGTLSNAYTGETGKIYTDLTTNKVYRWSGSAYVVISETLALGETSATAYRGDLGAAAYAHAVTNKGSAFTSGFYKITTNSQGHVTAATAVAKSDITALGIPAQDTVYTHPTTSGNKHIPSGGSSGQILRWSANGTAVWGSDNNTWIAFKGATTSAAGTAGYAPAPAAGAANRYLRSDGTWAVPPDNNTTYSDMKGATSSAAGTHGLVPAPAAGKQTSFLRGDGTWVVPTDTNTHYTANLYAGDAATSQADASSATKNPYLNLVENGSVRNSLHLTGAGATSVTYDANGSIIIQSTDNNTTYSAATTTAAGLMSASDKSKLDGITASADTVSFSRSLTSGTKIGTITINGTATDLYCQTNTDTTYAAISDTAITELFS